MGTRRDSDAPETPTQDVPGAADGLGLELRADRGHQVPPLRPATARASRAGVAGGAGKGRGKAGEAPGCSPAREEPAGVLALVGGAQRVPRVHDAQQDLDGGLSLGLRVLQGGWLWSGSHGLMQLVPGRMGAEDRDQETNRGADCSKERGLRFKGRLVFCFHGRCENTRVCRWEQPRG